MFTSQMMRSGTSWRACSAPSAPSPASWVSKPLRCSAQTVAWRKISSSSMTRILCMSGVNFPPRVQHLVDGGEQLLGGERFQEERRAGQVVRELFILAQSAGRDDANVRIEPAERVDGGRTIQKGHDH